MDPVKGLGLVHGGNVLLDPLPTPPGPPDTFQISSVPSGKGGKEGCEWVLAGEHQEWESVIKSRRKASQNFGDVDGCLGDQSCGWVLGEAE